MHSPCYQVLGHTSVTELLMTFLTHTSKGLQIMHRLKVTLYNPMLGALLVS